MMCSRFNSSVYSLILLKNYKLVHTKLSSYINETSNLHKQLCVIKDRKEGPLCEIAAGGSEVGLPGREGGVQVPQALLHHLNHPSL